MYWPLHYYLLLFYRMSRRVHKILNMVRDNSRSIGENVLVMEKHSQTDNPVLEEPDVPLNESLDSNSIPDSQSCISLSLLDDECLEKRPNLVVPESNYDSDTSESTSSTSSVSDFSSDDSVKDPDFLMRQDLALTDSDSDNDCIQNVNLLTKSRLLQLSPQPGPSGLYKEIKASGHSNPLADISFDDVPMRLESETIDPQPSDLQSYNDNMQVGSVGISSVETASPCNVENENIEKRGHKRKANPNSWQKNMSKLLRNSGKAYTSMSKTKRKVEEKKMGSVCSVKCKFQCSTKITHEERLIIFNEYWNTGDLEAQRQFIYNNLTEIEPKYRYTRVGSSRKNHNNAYYLPLNSNRTRVCKVFFMNTLSISDTVIRTVVKKYQSNPTVIQFKEQRGKHTNHYQLEPSLKHGVRAHINSIPRIESHYCRSQSKREYIEGGLTLAALHRDYVENCVSENKQYVSYQIYYNIFMNEFNISFWQPKKDQCEECTAFKNCEDKSTLEEKHQEHLNEKVLARAEKEKDKGNVSENLKVAVYDLQAVMPCPRGEVSSFYYVSKINVLNFTITELGSKNTTCFVWHEGEGARGVNEIGSCVLMYLKDLNNIATEEFDVIFYSDNCCGQQKNKFMVSMYQYATNTLPKLRSVTHKFLIKGHTQNEGDAVHSTIQKNITRALKSSPIYVPDQYITLIKTAKMKGSPYIVKELAHDSFVDLKPLASGNYTINEDKEKVKWSDIKVLKIDKYVKNQFLYKTSYQDNEFKSVSTLNKGRQQKTNPSENIRTPKKLYNQKLNVTQAKKQGILNLINKNIIPKYYESFFANL
ncbi:unnamed protein product [Chrysodeixis includens]|uniref:DUF7869 domain-containing protein n=1 Tax=Chrysodeixis includens TaxID=689277 RepID=A0A9N8PYS4_CHRIL|nr:unnamed protein product [Chrysodeixis includens]